MITAIAWVPQGASKSQPVVAEIEEIISSANMERSGGSENEENDEDMDVGANEQDDEVAQALSVADALGKTSVEKCDDITLGLEELDMDNYDEEDEGVELFGSGNGDLYYASNDLDPYLKDEKDDDCEEIEDMTIYPTDSVLVCARKKHYSGLLEVWILEGSNANDNYVHHDLMIPAFPLCTAWLDCPLKGGERGNFIAVGSMDEPSIEIWDLDVVDEVQPCMVLGGIAEKSMKDKDGSHIDSVLSRLEHGIPSNILASGSADKQVKIWDVAAGKCAITMEHHSKEVQEVAWNHHAPQVLLSGSFDQTVVMKDIRMPSHSGFRWSVPADVVSLAWDPHAEHSFVVSLENGIVKGFDVRAAQSKSTSERTSTFTLHAHDKAVTSVSYNMKAANLLATASVDKSVKLWDLSNQPSCVASYNPKAGAVLSMSFSKDNPFMLAIGGSEGKLKVWDILSDAGVSRWFASSRKKNNPETGS